MLSWFKPHWSTLFAEHQSLKPSFNSAGEDRYLLLARVFHHTSHDHGILGKIGPRLKDLSIVLIKITAKMVMFEMLKRVKRWVFQWFWWWFFPESWSMFITIFRKLTWHNGHPQKTASSPSEWSCSFSRKVLVISLAIASEPASKGADIRWYYMILSLFSPVKSVKIIIFLLLKSYPHIRSNLSTAQAESARRSPQVASDASDQKSVGYGNDNIYRWLTMRY